MPGQPGGTLSKSAWPAVAARGLLAVLLPALGGLQGTPVAAQQAAPAPQPAATPSLPAQQPGSPGASLGTALEGRGLDSAYDGVVVNQTITMAGHDFFQAFVAAWRDKPDTEKYTLTVVERPSVRLGTQVWVEFSRRRVFQAALPPARARIAGIGEAAADLAYQNVVESEIQKQLFRDPDLGPDEI
jgi:curli production assembly/transport component CsgE